ncbi:MAG: SRPBCC family protein [Hyphomicrobiales bacterium]
MADTFPSRSITIRVDRPWREVYEFLAIPGNFALWASGLGQPLALEEGSWTARTPLGKVTIAFTPRNELGIVDHQVTLPSGVVIHVPMRVVANAQGAEVLFTLFRTPDMTDEKFAEDAAWVERDLAALKTLLEGRRGSGADRDEP